MNLAALLLLLPAQPLLAGVESIAAPGSPGGVSVLSENATGVVLGREGAMWSAVVAAGSLGQGRSVAWGHNSYLSGGTLADPGTGKLMQNALAWAGRGKRIALNAGNDFGDWAKVKGYTIRRSKLPGAQDDLWVTDHVNLSDDEQQAVLAWIKRGGGVIAACTGWGWEQIQGLNIREYSLNRVLIETGLLFNGAMPEANNGRYTVNLADLPQVNAGTALQTISTNPTPQGSHSILTAARTLPSGPSEFKRRLSALKGEKFTPPTAKTPTRDTDAVGRLQVALAVMDGETGALKVVPGSETFPGRATGQPTTRRVTLEAGKFQWQSLGLYANAGDPIVVKLPAGAEKLGLRLQVGCHTDGIWHHSKWERLPTVTTSTALNQPVMTITSPFGGLVYVDVPRGRTVTGEIEITGAYAAPHFKLGRDRHADFSRALATATAPWTEIEGERMVVTVPTAAAQRSKSNFEELAKFWDAVADACADLAGWTRERAVKERYVPDQQISAGYMHSGYPIMTFLDVQDAVIDLQHLRTNGSWGHFHEIGHNHQSGDWTFDGTGEVTVNLFSMYITEKVVGKPLTSGHDAIQNRADREKRTQEHLAAGSKFERWTSDPFLALEMYIQLIEEFGWKVIQDVFREYRDLKPGERPQSEMQKRTEWMRRLSVRTGKNLGPFFEKWGVPTDPGVRASLSGPVWLPAGMR